MIMEVIVSSKATYSRRELLAGMQILEWTLVQMYLHGAGRENLVRVQAHGDPEAIRALKLVELTTRMGHHAFRDTVADLAPAHVEGERLGIVAAGLSNYGRSHDIIWTQLFMNICVEITDEGLTLKPNWQKQAVIVWKNIAREIENGIFPDFDPSIHSE
jgi:hypothetical protein